ncbi:MAG: hypothetical protein WCG45_06445 [bacterium]
MKKSDYLYLTIMTIAVMMLVYLVADYFASDLEPSNAVTWYYFAIFLDAMIAGGVFFKQRALWEIEYGYTTEDYLFFSSNWRKPLTTYLLMISLVIVLLFFVSFILSLTSFLDIKVLIKFQHLFRYPALISCIVQAVLTFAGYLLRDFEND